MNIVHPRAACGIVLIWQSLRHSFALLALLASVQAAGAQTVLPSDAMNTCVLDATEFGRWFVGGSVAKDRIVLPADSLAFKSKPDETCPAYKWSEQMFLWLTSPLNPERTKYVLTSPQFYGVEAPGPDEMRKLVPQNEKLNFTASISLKDSKGREVVADSEGKIRNVVRVQPGSGGLLQFLDKQNKPVDIARVASSPNGRALLLDQTNTVVDVKSGPAGAPLLRDTASGKSVKLSAKTALVNGEQRLLTAAGEVVEIGQAGGNDALMTRNKALVYYLIQVNDVFAYFRTGAVNGKIVPAPSQFPATVAEIDKVVDFAGQAPAPNPTSFQDRVAMAMEIKTSWVDSSTLSNPQDYLTISATVPKYIPAGDTRLNRSGSEDVTLALVGIHVVGTTLGHPEMIWATFEHVNNTPNAQYSYLKAPASPVVKTADAAGSWVFSEHGAGGPPQTRMKVVGTDIVAEPGKTIGPVEVTRLNPWGTLPNDAAFVQNNTDVISINKSIIGKLAAGDVRKNYIMIGSTWTKDGGMPSGGNVTGTTKLANSTMETFKQRINCFVCHSGSALGGPGGGEGLSHIWDVIKPLFP